LNVLTIVPAGPRHVIVIGAFKRLPPRETVTTIRLPTTVVVVVNAGA
jgi:hypothetical protein